MSKAASHSQNLVELGLYFQILSKESLPKIYWLKTTWLIFQVCNLDGIQLGSYSVGHDHLLKHRQSSARQLGATALKVGWLSAEVKGKIGP